MISPSFFKNAQSDDRFASYLGKAREEYDYLTANFADSPDYLSGWFHNFNCPHCAAPLSEDPTVATHSFTGGNRYRCSSCGKSVEGNETLDAAWIWIYRMTMARSLASASLFALLGEEEALSFLIKFVDFYADHYHLFPVHGLHAGKGKIMEQSLDEAVFLLALLRALFPVRALLPTEKKEKWGKLLFLPLSEFLLEQTDFHQIHNIALWMRCAIGAAALFMENASLLSDALDPPYGIRAQVEKGYTKDGIWNECSFHYHYYSTEALTEFLLFYQEKAPDDPLFDCLTKAYVVPASFSHDGFSVSSLSDGWYPLSLERYAPQIITAAGILRHPVLLHQVALLKEMAPDSLITTYALLYSGELLVAGEAPAPPSLPRCSFFEDSRLAVLRAGFTAIFRAGICRLSHMHDDYLSLVLPGISDDLGTPGYAHPLCDTFYRRSQAHNTVLADGNSQPHVYRDTELLSVPNGVKGIAAELWEGIDASRTLTAEDGALIDRTSLSSAVSHTYDWVFHVNGSLLSAIPGTPAKLTEDAFALFGEVHDCGRAEGKVLRFQTSLGIFEMTVLSDASLFLARSPSNPASRLRETVLLRTHADKAEFLVRYRLTEN